MKQLFPAWAWLEPLGIKPRWAQASLLKLPWSLLWAFSELRLVEPQAFGVFTASQKLGPDLQGSTSDNKWLEKEL